MSHKDLREQFIEQIVAKNYIEAEKLLKTDVDFVLTELAYEFEDKTVSVLEDLILNYPEEQPLDKVQDSALVKIIHILGRKEYYKKSPALILALESENVTKNGCQLALKLLSEGADISEKRPGQYKPLALICNEVERNPELKKEYNDFILECLDPTETDIDLNEICAFPKDKATAQKRGGEAELVKNRLFPLWMRLINIGYRDEINAYYKDKHSEFELHVIKKEYAQAAKQLEENPALADSLILKSTTVSDYVFSCLPRLNIENKEVEEAANFLALVAKSSANVLNRMSMTNNALVNISKEENVEEDLLEKYKVVVKIILKKGSKLTLEMRSRLTKIGFDTKAHSQWSMQPQTPARSRGSSSLSLSQSQRSRLASHLSRSSITQIDNSRQLADALEKLNFDIAESIINRNQKLSLQDIVFEGSFGSLSPARYLALRYPHCIDTEQKEICKFILELNTTCNSWYVLDTGSQNEVFESVKDIIKIHSERDFDFKEKTKSLLDFILEQESKASESSDESEAATDENDKVKEDQAMTSIVEKTIKECLNKFQNKDFDLDEVVTTLVRDTMNYAKTVSLDELTEIIKDIEKTILKSKDKRWEQLRMVTGAIVNKTADHYIEENKKVTATFHKTLWLCLTIIGALVPLFYYFLKVKPTRESSPVVVYEMTREAFNAITAKPKTEEEKTPRGTHTIHRNEEFSNASSRRHEKITEKQPRLISHKTEEKPEGHLKRCTFFSKSSTGKIFNGILKDEDFAYDGKIPVEVRSISLKGDQADKFAEKIERLSDEVRENVIMVC